MAKLFDIFGNFTSAWPNMDISGQVGIGTVPDVTTWLGSLNSGVVLKNIRTGTDGDRSTIEATVELSNAPLSSGTGYADGFPLVFTNMPDVEIKLFEGNNIKLFVSVSNKGAEVIVENLDVEIFLPGGLIEPPDDYNGPDPLERPQLPIGDEAEVTVFYRHITKTSYRTKLRIHVDEDLNASLITPRPISFEKCKFSGLSVNAIHDFVLIPSPAIARNHQPWLRHSIVPFIEDSPIQGMFAIRSLDIDPEGQPFNDLAKWMNERSENEPQAEFVIDDIVVPFYSLYVLPIPRHITLGIRKLFNSSDQIKNVAEYFDFSRAPVVAYFNRSPVLALIVRSLFYKSMPIDSIDEDLGLTFSAGLAIGGEAPSESRLDNPSSSSSSSSSSGSSSSSPPEVGSHVINFGLGEQYTIFAGYQLPQAFKVVELAGVGLYFIGFKLGYSIGRHIELSKSDTEDAGKIFGKSLYATLDLMVTKDEDAGDDRLLSIRSVKSDKVKVILEGIGYDRGDFTIAKKISMPDGVAIWIAKLVAIVIEEFGIVSEDGAGYISFTGGVLWDTSGFDGGITFKRMRFRYSGNPSAPPFKMDGFFLRLETETLKIEAGGYYSQTTVNEWLLKELGYAGKITLNLGATKLTIGTGLVIGDASHPTEDSFNYFLIQSFFRGKMPLGAVEMTSIQYLFTWNMQPRLAEVDRNARELRYYNWYKRSDPLRVPVSQLLTNWKPRNHAWAVGVGASVSFTGCGSMFELALFVMGMDGPDEAGILAALELFILGSKNPIGYAVLEIDIKYGRYSFMLGVDIKASNFLKNAPDWLDEIAKISGTLFASNDPGTVAIGRLSDERTWFGLELKYDIWIAKANFRFALCFEWVDGEIIGFAIVVRFEGGGNIGIIGLHFNLGLGILVAWFKTGSADYAVAIFIEGGLRIVLFGFIKFGISAKLEFRVVGNDPSRTELTGKFSFETPWFLPDITWTIEKVWGDMDIEELGSSSSPLRRGALNDNQKKTYALHKEGVDTDWDGDGVAPIHSVKDLRNHSSGETERLTRFANNSKVVPIATDATVHIEFVVAVNDKVLADPVSSSEFGEQDSGDLTLKYDLIGIQIRRRSRFGGGAWTSVDNKKELGADFSDSNGVELEGNFDPSNISIIWDPDARIAGKPAPKRLLINAKTPFEFNTKNPEADEENIKNNPNWPCCPNDKDKYPNFNFHKLSYKDNIFGSKIDEPEPFSDSNSYFNLFPYAYVRQPKFGTSIPAGSWVGYLPALSAGVIGQAVFDEEVAYVIIRMAWLTRNGLLRIMLFDRFRNKSKIHTLTSGSTGFDFITLGASFPIRSMEIQFISFGEGQSSGPDINFSSMSLKGNQFELDYILYLSVEDFLDRQRELVICGSAIGSNNPYAGKGKVSFLPNTEYEVKVKTRVGIKHPSDEPEPAEVEEYTYFKTKGLPGLNAVNRVGEELEPYVSKVYQGGMGLVYREEPVAISFTDDFYVAVPLTLRPSGTTDEHTILMEMQLLVCEDVAQTKAALNTTTKEDWIVDNRTEIVSIIDMEWLPAKTKSFSMGTRMISLDPSAIRLAEITQRPEVDCGLTDPLDVTGTVLIAPPQGTVDPNDATKELWPAQNSYTAFVRQKDAPLVSQESFVEQDLTAFGFYSDTSEINSSAWSVSEGAIHSDTDERQFALFGENIWNHLEISTAIEVTSGMAGIAISLPSGIPGRALFVMIQRTGESFKLSIYERTSGSEFLLKGSTDLDVNIVDTENERIVLSIWAYDDILKATVGERSLSIQRNGYREGRMALVADGEADFHSLIVKGLDMYHFPFKSSRFISFKDHVGSFSGKMDILDGSEMGATTAVSVASLYSNTRSQIQQVMQPGVEDLKRQAVFDKWQQDLALPLKEDFTQLEISRYMSGSQTAFFYLESPEPIDFSKEIEVVLTKRVRNSASKWVVSESQLSILSDLPIAKAKVQPGGIAPAKNPKENWKARKKTNRDLLFDKNALEGFIEGNSPQQTNDDIPNVPLLRIKDVDLGSDDKQIKIRLTLNRNLSNCEISNMIFMKHVSEGKELDNVQFFRLDTGKQWASGEHEVELTQANFAFDKNTLKLVYEILGNNRPGGIYALDVEKGILDFYWPIYTYVNVDTLVLQDGSHTRALIIPGNGSSHKMLSSGRYALQFEITRKRWSTTDSTDSWNTYNQLSVIKLDI